MREEFSSIRVSRNAIKSLSKVFGVTIDQSNQIVNISPDTTIGISRWGHVDGLKRCGYIVKFNKIQNQNQKNHESNRKNVRNVVGGAKFVNKKSSPKTENNKEGSERKGSTRIFTKVHKIPAKSAWVHEREV